MNNEIKEILDELENYYDRDITLDEIKLIRDYITNLQEERNNMACLVNELQEDKEDLQEEKIQLEGKIKQLEHNCKQASDSCRQHRLASKNHIRRLKRREKQINLYKSRCEKANKFIDEEPLFEDPFGEGEHTFLGDVNVKYNKKLKSILNGGDDNG